MLVTYGGYKEIELEPGDLIKVGGVMGSSSVGVFLGCVPHSRPNVEWGRFNWVHVLFGESRSHLNSNLIFLIEKL